MKDFYNVLGVSKTTTVAEIKKAYRNLSKIHHPDKGGNEEKFKEINEAFSTLGDATKRMQYDNPPQQHKFEDFFQHFGFSNGFEFNFSGGNPFQQSRTPQEDLNIVIEHYISFKDIYNDTQQEVSYERFVQCQSCDATGLDHNSDFEECKSCDGSGKHPQYGSNVPCPDCNGQGGKYQKKCQRCNGNKLISRTEKVTVNNVYSLTAPQTMNYRGMGHYSQYEHGRRGDAIIQFIPAVLEGYTRQHANLYYKMPIHFSDAITGVHMPYEHVDGKKINVKLPENTKNGEKLKLSGLGLLQPDKRGRGDLLIEVDIMIDYDRLNKEADTK